MHGPEHWLHYLKKKHYILSMSVSRRFSHVLVITFFLVFNSSIDWPCVLHSFPLPCLREFSVFIRFFVHPYRHFGVHNLRQSTSSYSFYCIVVSILLNTFPIPDPMAPRNVRHLITITMLLPFAFGRCALFTSSYPDYVPIFIKSFLVRPRRW